MRLNQAPAPTFTDAAGNNKKAPALTAWLRQARGAVVNIEFKPTGASAINTRASLTPTYPSDRTQSKLAFLLLLRSLVRARHGADNERSAIEQTDPSN